MLCRCVRVPHSERDGFGVLVRFYDQVACSTRLSGSALVDVALIEGRVSKLSEGVDGTYNVCRSL